MDGRGPKLGRRGREAKDQNASLRRASNTTSKIYDGPPESASERTTLQNHRSRRRSSVRRRQVKVALPEDRASRPMALLTNRRSHAVRNELLNKRRKTNNFPGDLTFLPILPALGTELGSSNGHRQVDGGPRADLGFYIWAHAQRVRLFDIDAPELKGDTKAKGEAATAYLSGLIGGKTIILKTIKGKDGADRDDSFGRWLGIVYLDGKNINQMMIEAGLAVPCTER